MARTLLKIVACAAGYIFLGWLGLLYASLNNFASPIWPAAGLALFAVQVYGWPGLLGVALGSYITNYSIAGGSIGLSATFAFAAMVEAVVSSIPQRRLVKRDAQSSQVKQLLFLICGTFLGACRIANSLTPLVAPN